MVSAQIQPKLNKESFTVQMASDPKYTAKSSQELFFFSNLIKLYFTC